jgi:hypothetical protein
MLLTNHTLTGVALGLSIDNPAVLLPTAVASHLALDAVPHFGWPAPAGQDFTKTRKFILVGGFDFALSGIITLAACLIYPTRILNILVGVFGADLPDLTYIPIILFGRARVYRWLPFYKPMSKFLADIQWFEKPIGFITEVIWAVLMLAVINVIH